MIQNHRAFQLGLIRVSIEHQCQEHVAPFLECTECFLRLGSEWELAHVKPAHFSFGTDPTIGSRGGFDLVFARARLSRGCSSR